MENELPKDPRVETLQQQVKELEATVKEKEKQIQHETSLKNQAEAFARKQAENRRILEVKLEEFRPLEKELGERSRQVLQLMEEKASLKDTIASLTTDLEDVQEDLKQTEEERDKLELLLQEAEGK